MPQQRFWIGFPGLEIILTGVKRYPAAHAAVSVPGVQAVTPINPPVAPPPSKVMPPPEVPPAVRAAIASGGCAPVYTNLCWALRNGMVDASQFDPQELLALQYRCSQLGYTGNCPPPDCVGAFLAVNRGNLPHIPVPASLLVSIGPAPAITDCLDSWRKGGVPESYISGVGLSGFRGRRR